MLPVMPSRKSSRVTNGSHAPAPRQLSNEVHGRTHPNASHPTTVPQTARSPQPSRDRQASSSRFRAASTARNAHRQMGAAHEAGRGRTNDVRAEAGGSTQRPVNPPIRTLPSPPGNNGYTSGRHNSSTLEPESTTRTTQGILNPILGHVPSRPTSGDLHGFRVSSRGRPLLSRDRTARTGPSANADDTVSERSSTNVPTEAASSPTSDCSTKATTVSYEHLPTYAPQTNYRRKRFHQDDGPAATPVKKLRTRNSPKLDEDSGNEIGMFDAHPHATTSEEEAYEQPVEPFFDSDGDDSDRVRRAERSNSPSEASDDSASPPAESRSPPATARDLSASDKAFETKCQNELPGNNTYSSNGRFYLVDTGSRSVYRRDDDDDNNDGSVCRNCYETWGNFEKIFQGGCEACGREEVLKGYGCEEY